MPKVSKEHLEARRDQILDGARSAFARDGYHGATVSRLEQEMTADHADYVRLASQGERLTGLRAEIIELEDRWLELSALAQG